MTTPFSTLYQPMIRVLSCSFIGLVRCTLVMATGRPSAKSISINPPTGPTFYRSRDNLKNFCIRVELKKVRTSGPSSTLITDLNQADNSSSVQESEELTFRWQEKVFSQDEEELYADANNCLNAWEELYHKDIVELRRKGGRNSTRLFSYIEKDNFKAPVTIESPVPVEPESAGTLTFAARHDHLVQRRHRARSSRGLAPDAVRHPVTHSPSNDERLSHRVSKPTTRIMYLMADLRHLNGIDEADEHVLCSIIVDENGVISIEPDFNPAPDKPTYRIENKHRELFEYRLVHASNPLSSEALVKEKKLMSELSQKRVSALNYSVGTSFTEEIPDKDYLRVVLLGEIVCGWGFEYSNLYVCAHLDLPENWELESEDCPLSPRSQLPCVVTQLCSTRSIDQNNVAHFNCPFEFTLLLHQKPSDSSKYHLPQWPRVLVEISSLDYWDRHRVEGYGFLNIPKQSGVHELKVETWRPVGRPVIDQMNRFFIGGPPELDDITYVATPKEFQGTHLSRYGFETETSGSLQFRFNIIHQSSSLVKESTTRHRAFKGALAAVLQSYQRAKDRALAASSTISLPLPT